MNIVSRILVACFLGAFIGARIALKISPSYPHSVWVGILIGGIVGYLTYSIRQVMHAAHAVWKAMPERALVRTYTASFFKTFGYGLLSVISSAIILSVCFLSLISVIGTCFVYLFLFDETVDMGNLPQLNHPWIFYIGGTIASVIASFVCNSLRQDNEKQNTPYYRGEAQSWKFLQIGFMVSSPGVCMIAMPLAIVGVAVGVIVGAVYLTPRVIRIFWALAKGTFLIVHSEIRLICAVDAILGGTIGWYFGNEIVGGIAGALLGVLNYQLVSIRWLKLVPKTA